MATSLTAVTEDPVRAFPFEVCNLLLGKGGSGQVFLGRLSSSDKYVAIKKRYARCDLGSARPASPSVAGLGWSRVLPRSKCTTAQTVGFVPIYGCREEGGSQSADTVDVLPASQRREHDLGEESASQVAALSQQPCGGSSRALEMCITLPPRQAAAFVLTDEVSVLHFVGPHPQIVEFLGSYTTSKNTSFLTLELMDSDVGRELKESNAGIQSEEVCAAVAYSVLLALEELHSRAIAHRDVKPGNILLKHLSGTEHWPCCCLLGDESGSFSVVPGAKSIGDVEWSSFVKVALGDFSAAHSMCCADDVAFSDTRGTMHYKAPEQLMGKRSIVTQNFAAVDLWGLGCTLFEMMTGARPFPGSSELQVLLSILDALGSDFQSYPALTRTASLFDKVPASPYCVDLLRRLLCLDPAQRCTAREALDHPFFASVRRADSAPGQAPCVSPGLPRPPHIIGIPLALKYATVTQIPGLRFSRILRARTTPAENATPSGAPATRPDTDQAILDSNAASESPAEAPVDAQAPAAVPTEAQSEAPLRGAVADTAVWHQSVEGDERDTPSKAVAGVPNADTTATSFFSESSYLHWSEVRPVTRPPAPLPTHPALPVPPPPLRDSRAGSGSRARVVTLFGANGNSSARASSSESHRDHHRQKSHSSSARHASGVLGRLTVSRALNISDSSVKAVPARRSSSHVDFDLSPVTATQLFAADADVSTCIVPHPGLALAARRPQPVLHLTSGSTFTASNLRANSSFERENLQLGAGGGGTDVAGSVGALHGAAALGEHCSTPRQGGGSGSGGGGGGGAQRLLAFAGRALCFSEETDRLARRSWGSSASQQSCLNSLLASPAPIGRVTEGAGGGSPQPSPIRPIADVARSPSGLPVAVAERSGLSSDESGVGLGWIGAPVLSSGAAALLRDLHSDGAPAPAIQSVHVPPLLTAGGGASQLCGVSPCPRRCCVTRAGPSTAGGNAPRARGGSSITSTSLGATEPVRRPGEAVPGGRSSASSTPCVSGSGAAGSRSLPLPIPLSVATVRQGSTPRTQRFSCATAELCRGGERSACAPSPPSSAEPCAAPGLREWDVNVPPARVVRRDGEADAGSLASLVACGARVVVHRHCTPSPSSLGIAQGPRPSASPSPTSAHAHTPVVVRGDAGTCELRRLLGDGGCTATPQSTRRASLKRSREEEPFADVPSVVRLGARVGV